MGCQHSGSCTHNWLSTVSFYKTTAQGIGWLKVKVDGMLQVSNGWTEPVTIYSCRVNLVIAQLSTAGMLCMCLVITVTSVSKWKLI